MRGKKVSKIIFIICLFLFFPLNGWENWIEDRIVKDLAPFQEGICDRCLSKYFCDNLNHHKLLVLVLIRKNCLTFIPSLDLPPRHERYLVIRSTLTSLTESYSLPNISFLLCLGDACPDDAVPIFSMCKHKESKNILFPDFEALGESYQVLPERDLCTEIYPPRWSTRKDKMIWRGSGSQGKITPENMHLKSRVILCQLSSQYPELIDAGFTHCIPQCVAHFKKDFLSYEEIFNHRYQIWIDGNVTSYGKSGWRFFSGSTVFKEDSDYEQWYFDVLCPNLHYIPVEKGLTNLIDKIAEMQANPILAELIASEGNLFIRTHLNKQSCLEYFFKLLCSYAHIPKKTECSSCN